MFFTCLHFIVHPAHFFLKSVTHWIELCVYIVENGELFLLFPYSLINLPTTEWLLRFTSMRRSPIFSLFYVIVERKFGKNV